MYTRVGSEGCALRLLLRVPLLGRRVSPHVLQRTQAQCRAQLYVDGGNVKVDEIWKVAERWLKGVPAWGGMVTEGPAVWGPTAGAA